MSLETLSNLGCGLLSTATVVNNPLHSLDGQTTASLSYLAMTVLAMSVDIESTLSYEIHIPSLKKASMRDLSLADT